MSLTKVLGCAVASAKCRSIRRRKKKIVFTNGCFDILHVGHVSYLQRARQLGDVLVVGLNSDASIKRLKGKDRPIFNQKNRAFVLSALACVDMIVIFNEDTPLKLIQQIRPDVLVKGGDWPVRKIVGYEQVTSYGGKVKSLSFVDGFSTTKTLQSINSLA